jgi:bacteriorhodopsin
MNNRNINAIISIASVVIMIIWGTLAGSYRHAWIAVFIGGVLITCLSLYNKGRADTDKADTDKAGGNGGESSKGENDPAEK